MKPFTLTLTMTFDVETLLSLLADAVEKGTTRNAEGIVQAIREQRIENTAVPVQSLPDSVSPQAGKSEPSGDLGEHLLDGKAVAKLLGVSQRMVWRLKDGGRMPRPIKIGSLVRWKPDEIHQWIEAGCPKVERRGVTRSRQQ